MTSSARACAAIALAVIAALAAPGALVRAQQAAQTAGDAIKTVHVRENVWMLVTSDGNLALQIGNEGALLVDTGRAGSGDAVLAAVRSITDKPLRYIINTSAGPNQIGNNGDFGALRGGLTDRTGRRGPTPAIIGHEAVLTRLSGPGANGGKGFPATAWPTDAYAVKERSIRYNGEAIDIIHIPNAYSDADSLVYFRRSDVIVAGEIYSTKRFPLIDRDHGGTVTGVLDGLNRILEITVPEVVVESFAEGGTLVIPGSGRISDEDDVNEYRDMVSIVRDRVKSQVEMKRTLEQVKAAKPLVDYDARYSTPSWTTSMFIDAMYAEMTGAAPKATAAAVQGGARR
jgi:glyoxylase-like metal-dependent hydrolase (beta-lactamase superfamily II)